MKHLFKAEKIKLYYSKKFWIIAGVIAILSILNNTSYLFNGSLTSLLGGNLVKETSEANNINIFSGLLGSIDDGFITFLIIFVSIFIGKDFDLGMFKNIVSRGFNKKKIYISKIFSSIYATIIFLLISMICSLIIGLVFFQKPLVNTNIIVNFIETITIKILLVFAITSISVLITTIVRNVGYSILTNLLVIRVIPSTLAMTFHSFSKYEISNNMYKLIDINTSSNILIYGLVISLVYIILSNSIGMYIFAKNDL
ncbi:ABC transporter permease [Clostridium tyrobutyricum]|uniref:ABC transporter permease n=1 Tax=Clostridium tyrobutyricum TaxID=1519 RepID=UPI001C3890A2|nr:ABC transporter permease [Clostridium tyrobutyricum]MBV4416976.1 ABC transporter permease [Clostridium tyrobutyricum]